MFAAVIISIIGAIKNKKKGIPSNIVKKLNIVLYSSMAAVIINNVILVLRFSSFVTYSSLLIHFIFNILYAIFVPVCIGFMIVKWKKVERKSSKVFIVFSMVTTLIFAVLLITWGFWY
jgi:Fe2+ transport system protein B